MNRFSRIAAIVIVAALLIVIPAAPSYAGGSTVIQIPRNNKVYDQNQEFLIGADDEGSGINYIQLSFDGQIYGTYRPGCVEDTDPGCRPSGSGVSVTFSLSHLNLGPHTFSYEITDRAGNELNGSTSFVVDQKPTIIGPDQITLYTADDNEVWKQTVDSSFTAQDNGTATLSYDSGVLDGTSTSLTLTATDNVGLTATKNVQIVWRSEPPQPAIPEPDPAAAQSDPAAAQSDLGNPVAAQAESASAPAQNALANSGSDAKTVLIIGVVLALLGAAALLITKTKK